MIRFNYKKPASLAECLDLLNHYQGKARLFAGGTDLMVEFRADDKKLKDVEVVIFNSQLLNKGAVVSYFNYLTTQMIKATRSMSPKVITITSEGLPKLE